MPAIKIRIRINKPSHHVSLGKLHSVLGNLGTYLSSLSNDLGIPVNNDWLISDTTQRNQNDAIAFNIQSKHTFLQADIEHFSDAMNWLSTGDKGVDAYKISRSTIISFRKITENFEDIDKVYIGSYKNNNNYPSNWIVIDKNATDKIAIDTSDTIEFYGDIQGTIKSFSKEKKKNKCKIREIIFNSLVDCEFSYELYKDVAKLLVNRDAIVHAHGLCSATRDGHIFKIIIEKITECPAFNQDDIDSFRGCYPEIIDSLRSDELPGWLIDE